MACGNGMPKRPGYALRCANSGSEHKVVFGSREVGKIQAGLVLILVVNGDRLEVFGLKDLSTVHAADVIDTVPACNRFSSVVIARF